MDQEKPQKPITREDSTRLFISLLGGPKSGRSSFLINNVDTASIDPDELTELREGPGPAIKNYFIDGTSVVLEMLDPGYMPSIVKDASFKLAFTLWHLFSDGFFVIFDITNRQSFVDAILHMKFLELRYQPPPNVESTEWNINNPTDCLEAHRNLKIQQDHENPRPPIILIGTKSDLAESRVISPDEAKAAAKENFAQYIEVSSKTHDNIELAYHTLIRLIFTFQVELSLLHIKKKTNTTGLFSKIIPSLQTTTTSGASPSSNQKQRGFFPKLTSSMQNSDTNPSPSTKITGHTSKDEKL